MFLTVYMVDVLDNAGERVELSSAAIIHFCANHQSTTEYPTRLVARVGREIDAFVAKQSVDEFKQLLQQEPVAEPLTPDDYPHPDCAACRLNGVGIDLVTAFRQIRSVGSQLNQSFRYECSDIALKAIIDFVNRENLSVEILPMRMVGDRHEVIIREKRPKYKKPGPEDVGSLAEFSDYSDFDDMEEGTLEDILVSLTNGAWYWMKRPGCTLRNYCRVRVVSHKVDLDDASDGMVFKLISRTSPEQYLVGVEDGRRKFGSQKEALTWTRGEQLKEYASIHSLWGTCDVVREETGTSTLGGGA